MKAVHNFRNNKINIDRHLWQTDVSLINKDNKKIDLFKHRVVCQFMYYSVNTYAPDEK